MTNLHEQKNIMLSLVFIFFLTLQSGIITLSHSKSIIKSLPGYPGRLPFKLETGYVGIGEKEDVQLFYYFVESERNPKEDPIIFYLNGGPGCSGLYSFGYQIGPVSFKSGNVGENLTITLNPNSWTKKEKYKAANHRAKQMLEKKEKYKAANHRAKQMLEKMASIIFMDIPVGTGFSYAKTKEAWISSDSIMVTQAKEFVKKFLINHPKFLKNPLYISGISYVGIVIPIVTLELYDGNERGDQPTLNIQGYILCSPLTDKFIDFNSRIKYAHRATLISDDIYKSAIKYCHGDYVDVDTNNLLCGKSMQQYEQCISRINLENILDPFCDENDLNPYCDESTKDLFDTWANDEVVQQALNIRHGMIEKWEVINETIHYSQGKNDTFCYAYDIFSSVAYHKKLVRKNCRALIYSGDHDMTFPYVGIEQWIVSLNLGVESPWNPFYVDDQVGGYEMTYAQNDFSLTFATVKGAGHSVSKYKPKEAMVLTQRWLDSRTYSRDT